MRGIQRRGMSRRGWRTISAGPTSSVGRCWSGWWRMMQAVRDHDIGAWRDCCLARLEKLERIG